MHMRRGLEPSRLASIRDPRRSRVNPIRIHLGPMPEMLRTIVGDLLGRETDLLLVGHSERGQDTLQLAQDDQADVLITQDRSRNDSLCLDRILSAVPMSILTISDDGHTADAVGLVRRPIVLNGGDRSGLAEVIREIADGPDASDAGWERRRPAGR